MRGDAGRPETRNRLALDLVRFRRAARRIMAAGRRRLPGAEGVPVMRGLNQKNGAPKNGARKNGAPENGAPENGGQTTGTPQAAVRAAIAEGVASRTAI